MRKTAKDGFYEHPCDALMYTVTAFAPPDPAAEVSLLWHEDVIRQATKLLARAGMTPTIPRVRTRRRGRVLFWRRGQSQTGSVTRRGPRGHGNRITTRTTTGSARGYGRAWAASGSGLALAWATGPCPGG